jgi:sec-independent protein translocase protein TatB
MFEIGWTELMLIGIVALIVIGPKDLPDMFRTMGRFTAKMRSMAREFSRAMETAAKESGANDIAADLKSMTSAKSMGLDAVKDAASKFEKWDPLKNAAKPSTPAPPVAAAAVAAAEPVIAAPAVEVRGPATQALIDAQAAKKAIAVEAAEKMRAVTTAPVAAAEEPAAKPARKPRAPRAKKDA